jgi:hypothetical protein
MLPRTDLVIVTTPSVSAQKVAIRAADMARRSFLRVAGVIENMSAFTCEHGESYPLFGEGGGRALADEIGAALLGQVPIESAVANGGDIGELVSGNCYWNGDGIWFREKNDPKYPDLAKLSDFEWQCWNWYHWDWLSGDQIVEQHLHNLDVVNWAFGGPPVKFYGMGGRQNRGSIPGNIWDHFAVEMEYANGARVTSMCRHTPKSTTRIAERIVGTKGMSDCDKGLIKGEKPFNYSGENPNPYVVEHTDLINSIRNGTALNEGEQVAISTMTAIGGRMAAYTGREIKWQWLMEGSKLDIFPKNPGPGPGLFTPVPIPGKVELI